MYGSYAFLCSCNYLLEEPDDLEPPPVPPDDPLELDEPLDIDDPEEFEFELLLGGVYVDSPLFVEDELVSLLDVPDDVDGREEVPDLSTLLFPDGTRPDPVALEGVPELLFPVFEGRTTDSSFPLREVEEPLLPPAVPVRSIVVLPPLELSVELPLRDPSLVPVVIRPLSPRLTVFELLPLDDPSEYDPLLPSVLLPRLVLPPRLLKRSLLSDLADVLFTRGW